MSALLSLAVGLVLTAATWLGIVWAMFAYIEWRGL
jgi:hypothetical protein